MLAAAEALLIAGYQGKYKEMYSAAEMLDEWIDAIEEE